MDGNSGLVFLLVLVMTCVISDATGELKRKLCSQCSKCDTNICPPSEAYPHMTAFDDSLVAGALQSDYVSTNDRGVYSVPNIKGGDSEKYIAYYGWESTSGSASGYHRKTQILTGINDEFLLNEWQVQELHGQMLRRTKLSYSGQAWQSKTSFAELAGKFSRS
ncbi:hypothetical protein RND71_036992 [Anisodus tanguticus]|uniref:Uncharacterized protein n=1 Tax=Anisodus tanguticus TaxID=243964 RepID=A0AAE1UT86_9SOLA|nr:hypothetical protein RND71_036992 [Anisodus tanguticus]